MRSQNIFVFTFGLTIYGCSGSDSNVPPENGTGGAHSIGGSTASIGGSASTGGAAAGGNATTGGAPTGAAINTGGNATGGGAAATGGNPPQTGGAPTGGSKSTGGAAATGGLRATGGMPATGGKASGGAMTGGSSSTAGSSGTQVCTATYTAPCSTSGSPCSIDVNGTARQYYVKLPSNYSSSGSQLYPLVFEFHYLGGSAEAIFNDSMYNIRPNFTNAIYVIPQGLAGSDGNRGWPNANGQDVNFTKAMISTLESSYCIDTGKIFSAGFSYGGMMSITLGCQMPDVFRAIGVESGLDITGGRCNPAHSIAVWQTQGDQDTAVPPANAQAARDIFIKANHCASTTTAVSPSPCVSYDGCDSGYPVVWCLIAGEGHAIWNQSGPTIATFFKQF